MYIVPPLICMTLIDKLLTSTKQPSNVILFSEVIPLSFSKVYGENA